MHGGFSEENPKYIDSKCHFMSCCIIDLMQLLNIGLPKLCLTVLRLMV